MQSIAFLWLEKRHRNNKGKITVSSDPKDNKQFGMTASKYHAESAYHSAAGSVDTAIDFTSSAFLKAYAGLVGTFEAIKYAGLSVALVTAPVPTIVALAVLWLMELSIDSVKSDIDKELENKKKKREFEKVVTLLKKYGKIPSTAVVETEFVKLEIDSITGSVKGEVLKGKFKGGFFENIQPKELENLISTSPDKETASLIEAYLSYKSKTKCIQ